MRSSIATLAVASVLALSACSGDDKKADSEDSRPATANAAAGGGGNRTDAEATCDLLRRNTPKWKALGKEGTMAQLAIEYYDFVLDTSKPGDLPPDAAELDAITTKSCPEVRSELLKIMGVDKFLGTL